MKTSVYADHWLLCASLLALVSCWGCGGGDFVAQRDLPPPTRVSTATPISIQPAPLDQPLTGQELRDLVRIAQELPGGRLPAFESAPELTARDVSLHQFVVSEQQRLQLSLDPQWQAQQWEKDSELQAQMQELNVTPVALASLMVRVSGSWLAQLKASQDEGQSNAAAHQLATLEHQFARQLRWATAREQSPLTDWEREQVRNSLRETIACIEALRLTAQMPFESVQQVTAHRPVLAPLLPAEDHRQFEHRTESQATIIQTAGQQ